MKTRIGILSININGLNSPKKRRKTFIKLTREKTDIICLQETHIKKKPHKQLEYPKLGEMFYAADREKKKRGIVLYVNKRIEAKFIKADKEGRTLMVEIQLNLKKVLLVAIYGPNENQEKVFKGLYEDPTIRDYEHICLLGDFNAIMDKKKDYKKEDKRKSKKKILPKSFFQMAEEFGLVDAWRDLNAEKQQFTFFSSQHQSWSRIDMIWMTKELRKDIEIAEIQPNLWADHKPVKIIWQKQRKRKARWTLNTEILKEPEFIQKAKKEMGLYFKENLTQDTSLQNVWDAAKVVFRGIAISYTARRNKL